MEAVNRFNKKCLRLFPEPADLDEANRILHVFMDAWNYFPHKALGGKSPNDRVQEAMKTMPAKEKNDGRMPKVIIGNVEMEWEDYQKMLREIEKAQKPFKKWIEQEMLPKYKKYLSQVVKSKRTRESTYDVAERFFDRTLHVGFVTLEDVRSDFIQHDFPRWWPTHILYSNLNPTQVKKSLQKLFAFLELAYGYDMEEYGFERS